MTAIIFRPATDSDLPTIGRLGAALVTLHHGLDPRRFIAPEPETAEGYARYLGSQLRERDVFVWVAERDGVVVAYAYAAMEGMDWMALRGPAGVLHDIVVDPAHRGGGVGQRLLAAVLAEFARRGAPQVVLSTAARNIAAQRLFARAGFRQTMIEMTRDRDA